MSDTGLWWSERTDGDNEEGQPDIRYVYTPPEPGGAVGELRRIAP